MSTRAYWVPRRFKGKDVFVRSTEAGEPIVSNGRLDVRYNAKPGVKIYSGSPQNLEPAQGSPTPLLIDEADALVAAASGGNGGAPQAGATTAGRATKASSGATASSRAKAKKEQAPLPEAIAGGDAPFVIYTDGACSGNPGPAGSGIVILDGASRLELSVWLGTATNNIAELTAIDVALEWLAQDRARLSQRVILYSDSEYSIKVVRGEYRAKKNVELIGGIQERLRAFPALELRWVRGHVGVAENERADELARLAISRSTSGAFRDGAPQKLPVSRR